MNWKFIFLLTLPVRSIDSSQNCQEYLRAVTDSAKYNFESRELWFTNVTSSNASLTDCLKTSKPDTELVLELVSVTDSNFSVETCCRKPCENSRVQGYLSFLQPDPSFRFTYVEGEYFFRYRHCSCSDGYCFRCKTFMCSESQRFGETDMYKPSDTCGNQSFSYLTKYTSFSGAGDENPEENCTLEVTAVFPFCSPILNYSQADISVFQVCSTYFC